MKQYRYLLILAFIISIFSGCEKKIDTGLQEVHWDRDMCNLCKMVISERHYAVQVINPDSGKSYMFDDIGCAVLWFNEEDIPWENKALIYINDSISGDFIDARKAYYDTNSRTPMDYGFGAYKNKDDIKSNKKILTYEEVRLRILRGETMQNPILQQTR
jgi:nitrous oxide reductase accessory protein NosL